MKQSLLPSFTRKEAPRDEEAYNAQLLIRAGFVEKVMAGVYSYLPLGLRVLKNIETIIREEMNAAGAYEILMPVLSPKENWKQTGRWDSLDVLFKVTARDSKEYALGPTHEELVVPLAQKTIFSYKDLPFGVYQIQTKFRDEARAKSGLLRGREFLMKDLYSFHATQEDLEKYYGMMKEVYMKVFQRLGLSALLVEASGGSFSKFSHEFQVPLETGEDVVVVCDGCGRAQNREINTAHDGDACDACGYAVRCISATEVGNIFELKTKYSEPFGLEFRDTDGTTRPVLMGCYGIGVSRLMGVIAEIFHDEKGLMWPSAVAPFSVHVIALQGSDDVVRRASELYTTLSHAGISVLFDDRADVSVGEKFAESDLLGIPVRCVISEKTGDKVEIKRRNESEMKLVDFSEVTTYCKA